MPAAQPGPRKAADADGTAAAATARFRSRGAINGPAEQPCRPGRTGPGLTAASGRRRCRGTGAPAKPVGSLCRQSRQPAGTFRLGTSPHHGEPTVPGLGRSLERPARWMGGVRRLPRMLAVRAGPSGRRARRAVRTRWPVRNDCPGRHWRHERRSVRVTALMSSDSYTAQTILLATASGTAAAPGAGTTIN